MDEQFDSAVHPTSDRSILDLLKADYSEIKEAKDVYIPVSGWERAGLAIRYRLPENGSELDAVARKVFREVPKENQFLRGFRVALDTMIWLNEGLYVKPPSVDEITEYVELDPAERGAPLTLADGEDLAAIFGWSEVTTARGVVMKLFGDSDMAILSHAEKLNRWLVNTNTDITTEIWESGEV